MCFPANIVLSLPDYDIDLLKLRSDGRSFGVNTAPIAIIRSLMSKGLAQRTSDHSIYGSSQWDLTYCGRNAGQLINDIEASPLYIEALKTKYNQEYAQRCDRHLR